MKNLAKWDAAGRAEMVEKPMAAMLAVDEANRGAPSTE